jgi:hypothetical protein
VLLALTSGSALRLFPSNLPRDLKGGGVFFLEELAADIGLEQQKFTTAEICVRHYTVQGIVIIQTLKAAHAARKGFLCFCHPSTASLTA